MVRPYDILIVAGEGESKFLEAATTLDAAMTHVRELATLWPVLFQIYSHITGILFSIK
jgi:hypothetical protein